MLIPGGACPAALSATSINTATDASKPLMIVGTVVLLRANLG